MTEPLAPWVLHARLDPDQAQPRALTLTVGAEVTVEDVASFLVRFFQWNPGLRPARLTVDLINSPIPPHTPTNAGG